MLRNPELRAAVDEKPLVRISFELPPTEQAGSETLWAEKLDDGMYKLRNTPLLVEGLSYDDTVEAELDEAGILKFKNVLGRGWHSTYRIMVRPELSPTQAD